MEIICNRTVYSDSEIVDMYWRRDENAVSVTEARYGRYLYRLAYNVLKDEADSRTALADTYLGAWNSIPPARPGNLLLYLCKIARRTAIDLFRESHAKKRVRSELIISLDELAECIADEVGGGAGELTELLNSYLGSLDARRRQMFVCRYYYSDSVEDVARALSVSPSYVYRELATIRAGLKVYLENRGYSV